MKKAKIIKNGNVNLENLELKQDNFKVEFDKVTSTEKEKISYEKLEALGFRKILNDIDYPGYENNYVIEFTNYIDEKSHLIVFYNASLTWTIIFDGQGLTTLEYIDQLKDLYYLLSKQHLCKK